MSGSLEWLKKPFIVREADEEMSRHKAARFLTRPAIFPNGEPGVALYNNGNIIGVFPEEGAERFIHHFGVNFDRARRLAP